MGGGGCVQVQWWVLVSISCFVCTTVLWYGYSTVYWKSGEEGRKSMAGGGEGQCVRACVRACISIS